MINLGGHDDPRRGGFGPSPAVGRGGPLSGPRAALLETLRAQAAPTTSAALARAAGLHQNTVREHLDALVERGLATRQAAAPAGRGRPAWLYRATDADPDAASEYAGLATALAEAIHRGPHPVDEAVAAGQGWGRDLARQRGATPDRTAAAARREVVEMFDGMGFAPEADARAATVRLTRCPLLEAAHRYPDVVCGVHLGLARGALEEYGADPDAADLVPFAEPGACRLALAENRR
ncbi:helix-turn-helix domain-containing protein [Isoptericola sp. b515]|uniref:helix-turn-helix transcriptional regulator n=1 Tax=Isoptericola sp. b515 TaxID=3064652 RepID=UPI00271311A4|nr:helix-turn-helix domain-containing protein [Isoptericola sp. b515]MDO8147486.1 helix-turn-helix domain-containing protein [Isoptericola sp. b515]